VNRRDGVQSDLIRFGKIAISEVAFIQPVGRMSKEQRVSLYWKISFPVPSFAFATFMIAGSNLAQIVRRSEYYLGCSHIPALVMLSSMLEWIALSIAIIALIQLLRVHH
jgi:hypothetical protein